MEDSETKKKEVYSVDELVEKQHELMGQDVRVKGQLFAYNIGSGVFAPLALGVKGKEQKIIALGKVNRWMDEHKLLIPYLHGYLGEEIEVVVSAKDYSIKRMIFGETVFKQNQ